MRSTVAAAMLALPALVAAAPAPQPFRKMGTPIPITKRTTFLNEDKSVNFDMLRAHVASVQAKINRGFVNYKMNTGSTHPSDIRSADVRAADVRASDIRVKRASGADPLTDYNNQLWYGTISVGTPAVDYTVDFDTGSSDLVLPGPDCTTGCDGHTIYDPSASSTAQDLGLQFSLKYGDGSTVSGEQYTDTVSIVGMTATGQTLGCASEYSDGFALPGFPSDGLMGMAFQNLSVYGASPPFQSLMSQGQLDEPVFSFKLSSSGSELYIGGANSALYDGDFSYAPVTQQGGFWEANMDSVEGNGQTIMSNVDSVIDTGTTLIIVPPNDAANLYSALGGTDASQTAGSGFYTFACDSFPEISFTFGGTSFPISADSLNMGPVAGGSNDCVSALIGQDMGSSFWLLGDVFLSNVYTTFDVGNSQVGFATLTNI